MTKKITVIIPVYNGEKYIERCVLSVLHQSNFDKNDIEIILINDGSSDDSLSILREMQKDNPDIVRVIDQKNAGVAKTRNRGIQLATGIYTIFIDQDDWIDKDYCETLYLSIAQDDLDVVCGGYRRPDISGNIRQVDLPSDTEYGKYIIMAAWAKIHKTSFLRKYTIEFFSNKFGEDSVFTIKEIGRTDKWKRINYVGYNWYFNESSVSNVAQQGFSRANIDSLKTLLRKLVEVGGKSRYNHDFWYFMLRTVVGYLLFSGKNISKEEFLHASQELFSELETLGPGLCKNRHLPFGPKGETIKARVAIGFIVLSYRAKLLSVVATLYCRGSGR
ncbi:MAG: glycosyltransferase family 2 protein [Candidatus Saccharimonas sp.]